MSFLYPNFLYALIGICIPVIIHLFNFRPYKTIYFSNIKFLRNIKQETKAKSNLKHILVLIARILAITALVIAFAQPYISDDNDKNVSNRNIVGIYIDNSFSMEAKSKFGNILEVAKNRARQIINSYKSNTVFNLITNDFEKKHQHFVDKEQLFDFVSEIKTSPNVSKLSKIISRQSDIVHIYENDNNNKTFYILSDFQKSCNDFKNIKKDSSLKVLFLPLISQQANNLYIDSCWFNNPTRKLNDNEILNVKIINKSNDTYQNIPIKLYLNDSLKTLASFNIDENSHEIVKLTFTNNNTGILKGRIEITDYPVIFDNIFYFSYQIIERLEILSINDKNENRFFNSLFNNDDYFNLDKVDYRRLEYSKFSNYNVIILNEISNISSGLIHELDNYVNNGGTVMFVPEITGEISDYNDLLKSFKTNYFVQLDSQKCNIKTILYEHELYSNVFKKIEKDIKLPELGKHFVLSNTSNINDEILLLSDNNHSLLNLTYYGKGKFYVFSFPFSDNSNDFIKHPLFVPTIYNIALYSQPVNKLYCTIGKNNVIELSNISLTNNNIFHFIDKKNNVDIIPEFRITNYNVKLFLDDNIKKAGNYYITNNEDVISCISLNYNRSESDMEFYNKNEIDDYINKFELDNFSIIENKSQFLTYSLTELNHGKTLWKIFILLTLLFIGIEILLLRMLR
ncbi:MAG: BatA and WFA domain-containing protein [Bacteroidales bacterium]|nr:BatA and WFA domain-containing protein [Bacteroidales bacterium]